MLYRQEYKIKKIAHDGKFITSLCEYTHVLAKQVEIFSDDVCMTISSGSSGDEKSADEKKRKKVHSECIGTCNEKLSG